MLRERLSSIKNSSGLVSIYPQLPLRYLIPISSPPPLKSLHKLKELSQEWAKIG